ncbi:succinate dehydrogenase assembly factor 2 [Palleronia abyssalis]|uniref:FAD assembly factor SdhE n=1 Tax=Palleronia abyssalis TaxID=1501240 RepID=A0A2R8BXJ5_9RHOB|nr:succinate dehydrogenase assembly factor 2 [Palleronia abyssalis]SPJ24869.1 hypothetical protein PAA8504_02710 [Palleronia abyssalis]
MEVTDPHQVTLRRLRMRSMRRGIKEMDLILSAYAEERLAELDGPTLALYDEMLSENDQDLYRWVSGQEDAPERYAALIGDIRTVSLSRAKGE